MGGASQNQTKETSVPVKVYLPETRFKVGPLTAMLSLGRELIQYRSHIATLFSNEFKSSYRGTVLGVFWNIILPLVPVTIYLLLVNIRVFPSYDGMPPAIYISLNVMLWYLFTGIITRPITVVKNQAASAMKTSLPLSASIASSFAQLTFDSLIRFSLVFVLVCAYGVWPSLHFPGMLLGLLSAFVFCSALGLLLSIVNIVYSDTQRVVTIVFQYGLFLSGVIFPVSAMGPLAVLDVINPFCVFITATRDYLFHAGYQHLNVLLGWGAGGLILFFISVRFFYVMEHRIRGMV